MGENSKIEWCDHTFNPWRGCTKFSPGCANCYAEAMSKRNPAVLGEWGPAGTRVVAKESYWRQPLKWARIAQLAEDLCDACQRSPDPRHRQVIYSGRPRVFCASLADVFEERPELNEPRTRLWNLIFATPQLDWLILTKRPENVLPCLARIRSLCGETAAEQWHSNCWIGTSVEDRKHGIPRIDHLRAVPAAVRFLSAEPLLEDLGDVDLAGIHWVICGGESGPHARPTRPDWARSLRDQCKAAGVKFFFKQWGEWAPLPCVDPHVKSSAVTRVDRDGNGRYGEGARMCRIGKKQAGRMLDGREWNEFPVFTQGGRRCIAH